MGLAGPVTGDADEDDGAATVEEGGDESAGLSLPLLKSLSIFHPFSGFALFSSLFLRFRASLYAWIFRNFTTTTTTTIIIYWFNFFF